MRRGRLTGHLLNKKEHAYRPCWFFRKEEVHALQADREYICSHKRWLTGIRRKAGWED